MTAPDDGTGPGAGVPRWGSWLGWAVAAVAVVVLVVSVLFAVRGEEEDPPRAAPTGPDPETSEPTAWMSGGSGPDIVTGKFGAWRGRDVEIAGTWSDNNEAMVNNWQLQPDAEYGDWDKPMDVAIGAIGEGETWAEAADGAYDERWRGALTSLRELWAERPGTLYVRFAHEMNGNWYPWSVDSTEVDAFRAAWQRFRGLHQEIYPESQLVFCVNRESVQTGFDWRESFPGAEFVDVLSVDYYNHFPYVASGVEWTNSLDDTDQWGGPKGLQRHLEFAREMGLPMAVSEWSGSAGQGDSPAFIRGMYAFFESNGGTDPGQVLYEILFDVPIDDRNFILYGDTRMPESAWAYRELW
ncbi:glycosyl hydrolase [Trujillonella endophytica]|uniref:Glycosyl hydrolase family 26 n=1 Tax=Trujillonella endophytica TaxID=673521 RepID=A0A1H8W158_9ACTN|nr:glycosyl hydrolase [Trujillella endophytica]SEP21381.1 Glycosyl hydrolase family 26 [Trujillella endophytica]